MSNLKTSSLGSSTAVVTWDMAADGSVYKLDLEDGDGNTLTSVETEDTSVSYRDLTPSTPYTFRLYTDPKTGTTNKYKSIRFEGPFNRYITLVELRVFDGNGEYLDKNNFNFESTPVYVSYTADQAMNGNSNTSTYKNGATIRPAGTDGYWQANFGHTAGTEISTIQVYYWTHTTYLTFLATSKLVLTSVDGTVSTYYLEGKDFQTVNV